MVAQLLVTGHPPSLGYRRGEEEIHFIENWKKVRNLEDMYNYYRYKKRETSSSISIEDMQDINLKKLTSLALYSQHAE